MMIWFVPKALVDRALQIFIVHVFQTISMDRKIRFHFYAARIKKMRAGGTQWEENRLYYCELFKLARRKSRGVPLPIFVKLRELMWISAGALEDSRHFMHRSLTHLTVFLPTFPDGIHRSPYLTVISRSLPALKQLTLVVVCKEDGERWTQYVHILVEDNPWMRDVVSFQLLLSGLEFKGYPVEELITQYLT
jgi:hypothetical protein